MILQLLMLMCLCVSPIASARVRTASLKLDEVLQVRAALGIATLVQVPYVIQSAIIGDQSAFKVEYLNTGITIKPLRAGAKTNLYLMTEKRRFSIQLVTLSQDAADYVIYVKDGLAEESVRWEKVHRSQEKGNIILEVERIARSEQGMLLVEGRVQVKSGVDLKPEEFWLAQNGSSRMVQSLFLSHLKTDAKTPTRFALAVAERDLVKGVALSVELRRKESIAVQIPGEVLWH